MTSGPRPAAALRAAAEAIVQTLDDATRTVAHDILDRQPTLVGVDDTAALAAVHSASRANVLAIVSTLSAGVAPDSLDVPDGALELMDHVAVDTDGLPAMLRAYRLGAASFVQVWLAELARHTSDVEEFDRLARESLHHIAIYVDRISEVIVERWSAITEAAVRSGRRREAAVRALLAGHDADPADLDHPVDRPQLVVAVLTERETGASPHRIAAILAEHPRLELVHGDGTSLFWAAVDERTRLALIDRVASAVDANCWCVVGEAPPGLAAFVGVAHDVQAALRVMRRVQPPGTSRRYEDLALLTTLLTDEPRARRFADTVLGPLAAATPRAERLRATLRAYFDASERKSSAAAALGVHDKTVSHRLRQCEETLGRPIESIRTDLATALLINAALAGPGDEQTR